METVLGITAAILFYSAIIIMLGLIFCLYISDSWDYKSKGVARFFSWLGFSILTIGIVCLSLMFSINTAGCYESCTGKIQDEISFLVCSLICWVYIIFIAFMHKKFTREFKKLRLENKENVSREYIPLNEQHDHVSNYSSIAEYSTYKGISSSEAIEKIKNKLLEGKLINGFWYVHKSEFYK